MPSSQKRSLAERQGRWGLISSNRQQIEENLPNLAGDLSDLASVHKEVTVLVAKQAHYMAKAREVTAKIQTLSRHGDRLRGRIGASLRGKHGFDATELIRYGFKPRRANRPLENAASDADPADDFPGESSSE